MTSKGIYIYGIVPNFYSTEMFRSLENSELYAISYENVSAIVSDREDSRIDFSDRESLGYLLVHHQKTIEGLQNKGFTVIIPMRLGTIVSSKEEVLRIFANGYDLITDTLKKTQFLIEMDLAVTWSDFSGTLKEISNNSEVIALKDSIMRNMAGISSEDQMKVGMLVQSKLKEKNERIELFILELMSSISLDIKTHEIMNDQMVTNSAFLINRKSREDFEVIIDRLDDEYKGALNFKLIGPLPFYSFYTIEVKELSQELIAQANIDLGLGDETSESEIKKAYLGKAKLFHPDTFEKNGDEENFNRITQAYHTLLEYSAAARQSVKEDTISPGKANDSLILVKIHK